MAITVRCERTLWPFKAPEHPDEAAIAWCKDFIKDDSDAYPEDIGGGSCCMLDEALENWCLRVRGWVPVAEHLWHNIRAIGPQTDLVLTVSLS